MATPMTRPGGRGRRGPRDRRAARDRRLRTTPALEGLERRSLMSIAASWLGQDEADLTGTHGPGADGVLDIHIGLSGLPAERGLALVDVRPLGGGRWRSDGQGGDPIVVH